MLAISEKQVVGCFSMDVLVVRLHFTQFVSFPAAPALQPVFSFASLQLLYQILAFSLLILPLAGKIILQNEVQGLQVFKDDHWFDAKYIPNALMVHIGDQIEILSNGEYKSVLHRTTVNKEPVFVSPPADKVVGPLAQLVTEENPAKFKTKKYKEYEYCKLNKLPQ